jgi:hypothetical protein
MASAAYYQAEAVRFRTLAAATQDTRQARRLLQRACEYDQLAESMEAARNASPRRPVQPQQRKDGAENAEPDAVRSQRCE